MSDTACVAGKFGSSSAARQVLPMIRRTAQKATMFQGNEDIFRDAGEIFVIYGGPSGRHSPPALSLDFFLPGFNTWPSV